MEYITKLYENGKCQVYKDIICDDYMVCRTEGIGFRVEHGHYPLNEEGLAAAKKRCDDLAKELKS